MDDNGWTKTRKGRVVIDRAPHYFNARDVIRIVGNLIQDNQLSIPDRQEIANLLYKSPAQAHQDGKDNNLFDAIREYLLEKLLPQLDLALPLVTWLVDLEVEAVNQFLRDWVKKFDHPGGP